MQTTFIKNADARVVKCRQIMQTSLFYPPDGDACIFVRLQGFVYRVCLHFRQIMQTKFVYVLKSLSKVFCKVVCGNADNVCLEITSLSLFKYSIIEFSELKSSHPQRASPATSSSRAAAWLELTCTAENVLLCVRACHSSYAPVPFKSCVRASVRARVRAGVRASERACVRSSGSERQRAASSEQRAASSEQRAAASVHSSFVISSLGTKLGCFYITIACRIGMNN